MTFTIDIETFAKLKAIDKLHRAIEIYGECEDGEDCEAEHFEIDAYLACEAQEQKTVCEACCTDESTQCTTLTCEDTHDHSGGFLCETRAILDRKEQQTPAEDSDL